MSTVSIITPWSGSTSDLLQDYKIATEGCELIIVDNASDGATAHGLTDFLQPAHYVHNTTNLGFAAANNQGYAKATGAIIMFLNSDVAAAPGWLRAVAADVRDGGLYGPSLSAQLVAGRHIPYIEGWCIAATRGTWEGLHTARYMDVRKGGGRMARILTGERTGPWDANAYPGPYWEDNDLCFRALQAGITLVQTAWQVQHKGGRTAGPIMRHGESFACNERTFTERVLQTIKAPNMTPTWHRYMQALYTQSDIQHHLGLLYSLARGNVLELGTRTGVSTAALLAGVEAHGGRVWSVDVDPNSAQVAVGHPQWTFIQADSRDVRAVLAGVDQNTEDFDTILIDTIHTWEHVTSELTAWQKYLRCGGHICIHDPETFPGVRRAVTEFCAEKGWHVTFVLPCNGMAVIEVPG